MRAVSVALCQLESDIGSEEHDPRPENLRRARQAIEHAANLGAELIVMGEAYLNGYRSGESCWRYALAESEDDPYVAQLAELAAHRNVTLVIGATTHKGHFPGEIYNSALVLTPDGLAGTYSKCHVAAHLTGGLAMAEKLYWSPGRELPVFTTPVGVLGVEICYDIWFPEVARTLALKGAELMINVSAAISGFEERWNHLLFVRSWENCIPYVHINLAGKQDNLEFFGNSRLQDASGSIVAQAPRSESAVVLAEWDKSRTFQARAALHPFYNRNPALYDLG